MLSIALGTQELLGVLGHTVVVYDSFANYLAHEIARRVKGTFVVIVCFRYDVEFLTVEA